MERERERERSKRKCPVAILHLISKRNKYIDTTVLLVDVYLAYMCESGKRRQVCPSHIGPRYMAPLGAKAFNLRPEGIEALIAHA